ncbi:Polyadenylate-binding protein 2 [Linum perenne]
MCLLIFGYLESCENRISEEIAQVQRVNIEGASSNNDPQLALASLYVGDMDFIGDETQLFGLFSKARQVLSVRGFRDLATRWSSGYAYVNFTYAHDAAKALELLNFTPINGRPIRVMYSNDDPNVCKSGVENIFIKNLVDTILNDDFKRVFGEFGLITSDVIMRDICGRSNGFGFVNFVNKDDAARAIDALNRRKIHAAKELELLNFTPINGRPIRVMYSNNDPNVRKSGVENIFMKNFDKGLDHKALVDTFSIFGSILSCKLATHPYGHSKGYGFVQFDTEEAAKNAIKKLNEMMMNGKQLHVAHFIRKKERGSPNVNFKNVFVKNLVDTISNDDFKRVFGEFGPITSDVIMRDICGRSNGFGFVNFLNKDDAAMAIDTLNRRKIHGKAWYVGRAQRKNEREFELRQEAIEKFQDSNLYVKNIDDSLVKMSSSNSFPPLALSDHARSHGVPGGPVFGDDALLDMVVGAPAARPRPVVSIGDLTNALENATLKQQLTMLGENLYPLVKQVEPDDVGKVLDMDQTEVLHLLESPNALKAKVTEVIQMLKTMQQAASSVAANQMSSLSFNNNFALKLLQPCGSLREREMFS